MTNPVSFPRRKRLNATTNLQTRGHFVDSKPRKIYTQIGKKWTAKNGFYVKKSISQGILSEGNPKHSSQTRPKQAFYLNAKQKGC